MNRLATLLTFQFFLVSMAIATAAAASEAWTHYPGGDGPGAGRRIVLISGDEEYRSEQALPQLGKILAQQHGFECTVLYAIDPEEGVINPNNVASVPGIEKLANADLLIIATRFRNWPDKAMAELDRYLKSGRPVIGLRTATHAFNIPEDRKYAHYGNDYEGEKKAWQGGFGRLVLGEQWIAHHGEHGDQGTRGVIAEGADEHPILNGIESGDVWGPTDVYAVRTPLPDDAQVLLFGEITERPGPRDKKDRWLGMRPDDPAVDHPETDELMPIAWLKSYQLPGGERGQAFATTMGAATDLESEGLRRLLVNAAYDLLDLNVPEQGASAKLVGEYKPDSFGFHDDAHYLDRGVRPEDHRLDSSP